MTIHTYDVWITEPYPDIDPATGAPFWGRWTWDAQYSCEDARAARGWAHEYARYLRRTYPCSYVGVTPAGRMPLPLASQRFF